MVDYLTSIAERFIPLADPSLTPSKDVKSIMLNLIQNPNVIYVGEKDKGALMGFLQPYIFNPDIIIAQEIGWFIEHKHRNLKFALSLIKEFELKAKQAGANKILMVGLAELKGSKVANLYTRLGYNFLEFTFSKDL